MDRPVILDENPKFSSIREHSHAAEIFVKRSPCVSRKIIETAPIIPL